MGKDRLAKAQEALQKLCAHYGVAFVPSVFADEHMLPKHREPNSRDMLAAVATMQRSARDAMVVAAEQECSTPASALV
ncbi:MAG: hypothetical protein PHW10_04970 [Candidatus Peribacteraceae bacterium]|nr:hypothetical protein [Candidatus Peribacteraceae bacterium]